jgi:hypothetical protein
MGSSLTWKAAASRRVPRPKARLADSRRAGWLREPPRAAKIWSRSSRPQSQRSAGTDAVQGSVRSSNVCREGKEGRRQMLARPASDVRQLGGLAYAPVCYVVSMYRNCLTKRSSSGRTHREHERSFRSKGARPKMGQLSAAWGTLAS